MKFPYGISDFREIAVKGYFYCDRTDRIPLFEKGKYLLFLRPRRFGKSLLLSTLANYYDIAGKEEFQEIFGHLKIGGNPTLLHNQYFILKLDFSCVDPSGNAQYIKRALHDHVNSCIEEFTIYYEKHLPRKIKIDVNNVINTIKSLISVVRMTSHPIYLLIDEYDNFANEVMMGSNRKKNEYEHIVFGEGPLKTLFKAIKSSTSDSVFDRIFITGVSPVVMSDITSGYNIGKDISQKEIFNDVCGFQESEIEKVLEAIARECETSERTNAASALDLMRIYYNGYKFAVNAKAPVYNPTLAIYFMEEFYETCKYPKKMLDANLSADEAKLLYISQISQGRQLLVDLIKEDHHVEISDISDSFGLSQLVNDQSKDLVFMVSFLYYFGVLTNAGETIKGKLRLKVPNLLMQGMYVRRIQAMLLPESVERDKGISAAEQLYSNGRMEPVCEFVEKNYFKVFHNRDYIWANELTVKTAFLTLLYDDILYIMDSEHETGRGYSDLTMIIRPDMRQFQIFDILIEFKFVKLKDAGLTGKEARELSKENLKNIDAMKSEMDDAKKQVQQYGDAMEQKYKNLRLKRFAVVSLGFDRLWWEEIEKKAA